MKNLELASLLRFSCEPFSDNDAFKSARSACRRLIERSVNQNGRKYPSTEIHYLKVRGRGNMIAAAVPKQHWTQREDLFRSANSNQKTFKEAMEEYFDEASEVLTPQPAPVESKVHCGYAQFMTLFWTEGLISQTNSRAVIAMMHRIEEMYGSDQVERFYFNFVLPMMRQSYYYWYHRYPEF